jgi:hypothetical protein
VFEAPACEHEHGRLELRRLRPSRRRVASAVALTLCAVLTSCVFAPGNPGSSHVQFTIDGTLDRRPISPLIYGSNVARDLAANRLTLVRLGGNRWTAYNWENNASNAGSDWCFQNDGLLSSSSTPGRAVEVPVDAAHAQGVAALVTVPNVDYVSADKLGGSNPPQCSGDVRNSGPNYLTTRFRQNDPTKGAPFSLTPNTGDTKVYQDEFVNWLEQATTGPVLYSLDNEPDLWSATHAEVHPAPVTYAELVNRNIQYADAIKDAAPDALVAGPVNYGFYGFETLQGAPDAGANGHFIDYWLDRMRDAETTTGHRLVDYLDLHWYPEARGDGIRVTGTETTAGVVQARVQAPRSLWDSSYVEDSWITNDYLNGPIRLLPDMNERIAENYPGTQLAITEWNYGGGQHISGALATADALGVFGREGVGMACLWELNGDERYTYAAFKAFRNFDGSGGAFEDISIRAQSSDVATATVYASVDAVDPSKVVIIAINKANTARTAGITLRHVRRFNSAQVYTVTAGGGPAPVPAGSISPVATNAFNYSMPAHSISIIVPAV